MRLFHGTDARDAYSLVAGAPLSPEAAAASKIDGPPGFFLATVEADAEFFAARRSLGAVIVVEVEEDAVAALKAAGMVQQRITVTDSSPFFTGDEVIVPVGAFAVYNSLLAAERIRYV